MLVDWKMDEDGGSEMFASISQRRIKTEASNWFIFVCLQKKQNVFARQKSASQTTFFQFHRETQLRLLSRIGFHIRLVDNIWLIWDLDFNCTNITFPHYFSLKLEQISR